MSHKLAIALVFLIAHVSIASGQPSDLRITTPLDKAKVPERLSVEGTVANPKANVLVIVHPVGASDFWVQPSINVKENGAWKLMIYVGRPGTIDVGKLFEIRAVANPGTKLKEGDVLGEWPKAQWMSKIIEVERE